MAKQEVLVIGAGPAGMMAAGTAAQSGASVTVIDRNKRPGRKLLITGKGRCNVTNNCDTRDFIASVPTNGRFLYSALNAFSPQDTIDFFEKRGVPLKTERGSRVFPQSDKAADIVDAMRSFLLDSGCRYINGRVKCLTLENGAAKGVELEDGQKLSADCVVVACGGKSYPLTGSTGDGYTLARQAGHTLVEPVASLVPLVSQDSYCKDLQGLSLRNISITVTDTDKKKEIYSDFGELLFTHFGLSGPVILSASAHMRGMRAGRYRINIDCKPALTPEQLDKRLLRDFEKNKNRDFCNSLSELLPRTMIPVMVKRSGIPPETKCNAITKEQRHTFGRLLKQLPVTIGGFRPVEEAIVTSGGVNVKEIDPKTMESKKTLNLFFAGEVIDTDAYTGGFNLQIAFSTGYLAGVSAADKICESQKGRKIL